MASKLREVIRQEGVKISRPTMRAELRVRDIDVSVTADEIRDALAAKSQCSPDAIRMGPIRRAFNGMGTMWFQCPLVSANRMTEARRIRIGWTALKVKRLPARPLQCFKCLEDGHVQDRCPNNVDHRGRCHRCGEPGHISSACTREVHCIACAENNFPAKHRHGKAACQSAKRKRRGKPVAVTPTPTPDPPPTISTRKESVTSISTAMSDGKKVVEKRKLPLEQTTDTEVLDKEKTPKRTLKNRRVGRKAHSDLGLTIRTLDPEFEADVESP